MTARAGASWPSRPCCPRTAPSGTQATDSWDGYPAARQRLVRHLTPGAQPVPRNSVLLGGDLHQNYVCNVHADPEAAPERGNPIVASEFCSTSITSRSGTTQAKVDAIAAHNPQVLYARCEERGYGLADITPERWTSELRAVANPCVPTAASTRWPDSPWKTDDPARWPPDDSLTPSLIQGHFPRTGSSLAILASPPDMPPIV